MRQEENILQMEGVFARGYGCIAKFAMRDQELTITDKGLYAYLVSLAGGGLTTWPARKTILSQLHICKDTYYTSQKNLLAHGYLKVEHQRKQGKWDRAVYTICLNPKKYQDMEAGSSPSPGWSVVTSSTMLSSGYGLLPKAVMQDDRFGVKEKAVYAYFVTYANVGSMAYPIQEAIERELGITKKAFKIYLRKLTDCGYIIVKNRREKSGRFGVCDYFVTLFPYEDGSTAPNGEYTYYEPWRPKSPVYPKQDTVGSQPVYRKQDTVYSQPMYSKQDTVGSQPVEQKQDMADSQPMYPKQDTVESEPVYRKQDTAETAPMHPKQDTVEIHRYTQNRTPKNRTPLNRTPQNRTLSITTMSNTTNSNTTLSNEEEDARAEPNEQQVKEAVRAAGGIPEDFVGNARLTRMAIRSMLSWNPYAQDIGRDDRLAAAWETVVKAFEQLCTRPRSKVREEGELKTVYREQVIDLFNARCVGEAFGDYYADEFFEWLAVEYLDALEDREDNAKAQLESPMSYARFVIWTAMRRWTLKVEEEQVAEKLREQEMDQMNRIFARMG